MEGVSSIKHAGVLAKSLGCFPFRLLKHYVLVFRVKATGSSANSVFGWSRSAGLQNMFVASNAGVVGSSQTVDPAKTAAADCGANGSNVAGASPW